MDSSAGLPEDKETIIHAKSTMMWKRFLQFADGRPMQQFWAPDSETPPGEKDWIEYVDEPEEDCGSDPDAPRNPGR